MDGSAWSFDQELTDAILPLFKWCRKLTLNVDEAEDLMQSTLLAAIEHRGRFTPGTSMFAWLGTIARNRHRNELRRSALHPNAEIPESMSVDCGQDSRDEFQDMARIWVQVPRQLRCTLLAVATSDDYAAVAADLGIPMGTVRSRVSRARSRLRELLP